MQKDKLGTQVIEPEVQETTGTFRGISQTGMLTIITRTQWTVPV